MRRPSSSCAAIRWSGPGCAPTSRSHRGRDRPACSATAPGGAPARRWWRSPTTTAGRPLIGSSGRSRPPGVTRARWSRGARGPTSTSSRSRWTPRTRARRRSIARALGQTCNIVYPRELMVGLGGLDERMQGGEDADLAQCALAAGAAYVGPPRCSPTVPSTPRACSGPCGLMLSRRTPVAAALVLPWAVRAAPAYGPGPRGRLRAVSELPGHAVVHAAEIAVLARGTYGTAPSCSEVTVRIAILSPVFWSEVRRGTERFARDLADGLIARGHAVTLLTSHPGPPRRSVEAGLEVLREPPRRPPLDLFAPGGPRAERPTIICPAAIDVPRKRVALLADAFGLLRAQRPDARLVLSGRPAPARRTGREAGDRPGGPRRSACARRRLPLGAGVRAPVARRGVRARLGRGAGLRDTGGGLRRGDRRADRPPGDRPVVLGRRPGRAAVRRSPISPIEPSQARSPPPRGVRRARVSSRQRIGARVRVRRCGSGWLAIWNAARPPGVSTRPMSRR
jgi:hypothetical protein